MDAYRINIALNLYTNSGSASRSIQTDLLGIETVSLRLKGLLGSLGVGLGLGEVLKETFKATVDYTHQMETLHSIIRDNKQLAEATKAAWDATFAVPTSAAAGNLKAIGDLVPAFGNVKDALANVEELQRLSAVITNLGGNTDQVFDIAKALETRGAANNPSRFNEEAGMMVQASEATHGRVSARDYLQFIRQSNPFATGFGKDFLYQIAPTLMQDMGGSRAGTAINSLENTLVGGRMTKAAKELFQKFGLLDPSAEFKEGSAGTVQLKNSRVAGSELALDSPYRWVNEILLPALAKQGINDPKKIEEVIAKLFSNRNSERIAIEFAVNSGRYTKDAGIISQTENPNAAYGRLKDSDPNMVRMAVWAQLQDVMANIGTQAEAVLLPAMRDFRDALVELNKAFQGVDNVFTPLLNLIKTPEKINVSTISGSDYADKLHSALQWLGIERKSAAPQSAGNSQPIQVNVNVDGKTIASSVFNQVDKQLSKPYSMGSLYDPRMGITQPASP